MDSTSIQDFFVFGKSSHSWAAAQGAARLGRSVIFAQVRDLASRTSSAACGLIQGSPCYLNSHQLSVVPEAFAQCKTSDVILFAGLYRVSVTLQTPAAREQNLA